jgi:hypothetical protein
MIDWKRREAWVGVFDILGFKSLIRQTDQEYPRALLTGQLDDLLGSLDRFFCTKNYFQYLFLTYQGVKNSFEENCCRKQDKFSLLGATINILLTSVSLTSIYLINIQ